MLLSSLCCMVKNEIWSQLCVAYLKFKVHTVIHDYQFSQHDKNALLLLSFLPCSDLSMSLVDLFSWHFSADWDNLPLFWIWWECPLFSFH